MSDSTPAPAASDAVLAPVSRSWRRARVYCWAILIALAIWLLGGALVLRFDPKRVVMRTLAQLPFPSSVESVTWTDSRTLKLVNVKIGDFFYADSIVVTASVRDLLRHHVREITLQGPQLFTGEFYKALDQMSPASGPHGLDWTIDRVTIRRGTVMIDAASDLPSIPVRLGVLRPVVLNHLHLSAPNESVAMTEERVVELENINLVSPFDPLAPVLQFPLTRVRFTYSELWHHQIREIQLIRPTMYLGQDLFWFTDTIKKHRNDAPATPVEAPWSVGHFSVQYGQLAINAFGQPAFKFPCYFETKVDDIRLDQLDKLSAKSVIAIRSLTQDYPDYKLRVVNLEGKLEFSLPPTDSKANNVVPTIHLDELAWNDIAATDVWSSVTFDPTGIYGKLGGKCEKGYLKGNFEVYYNDGFKWNADLFADKIDTQPIAEKLAGKYFDLTGAVDGKLNVQGRATEILRCHGTLTLPHPGVLKIESVGDLLKKLPADTPVLKRQMLQIAVQAVETYPYVSGQLKIDYTPQTGSGTLRLDSPNGARDFSLFWHPYEASSPSSKVAKGEDSN